MRLTSIRVPSLLEIPPPIPCTTPATNSGNPALHRRLSFPRRTNLPHSNVHLNERRRSYLGLPWCSRVRRCSSSTAHISIRSVPGIYRPYPRHCDSICLKMRLLICSISTERTETAIARALMLTFARTFFTQLMTCHETHLACPTARS